jgi:hypothetical protein
MNFFAAVALLSFGAHFEPMLERPVADVVLFGLIGLYISKGDLSTSLLLTISRSDICSYFDVEPMEMVPHDSIPAISIEKPGPLADLVGAFQEALNRTGERLRELGSRDLATFIVGALKGEHTVARLVAALGAALPAFDPPLAGLTLHRKPLMLAGELYHRLRASVPECAFADFDACPPYASPAVVNRLLRAGVLRGGGGKGQAGQDQEAVGLAAGCVLAVDRVAKRLGVPALDVAYYLDQVAKGEEAAGAQGFVPPPKQTVM